MREEKMEEVEALQSRIVAARLHSALQRVCTALRTRRMKTRAATVTEDVAVLRSSAMCRLLGVLWKAWNAAA
jgi:hypothetical protein